MFAPPDTVWACQQDAAGVTGESVAVSPIVQWQDRLRPGCGFESRLATLSVWLVTTAATV